MDDCVRLSIVDRTILDSYKVMMDGLADYLGIGYEMVLHSLEDYDCSVIKVINGHYSGRSEGAPITNLALEMLSMIKEDSNSTSLTYFTRSKKGVPLRSTTIPIMGENKRIIGLLCMNFYMDTPLNLVLDQFNNNNNGNSQISETFATDIDELIISAVEEARGRILNDITVSAVDKNKEIVALLYEKGIFSLKDSVVKVADNLGLSKNTVYMHIRNLSKK